MSQTFRWWTALEGKTVLLIHRRAELLKRRFDNATLRSLLWPGRPDALPAFGAVLAYAPPQALRGARPVEPDWRFGGADDSEYPRGAPAAGARDPPDRTRQRTRAVGYRAGARR